MRGHVASLEEKVATTEARFGAKGATLAKLRQAGFPVPQGVLIDFEVYRQTISKKEDVNLGDICSYLCRTDELQTPTVAVRSSANIEDGSRASFAGQFVTRLCVSREHKELKEAIHACYAHGLGGNGYLQERNNGSEVQIGLVIQEMVNDPYAAGVIFTMDPRDGSDKNYVINVTKGYGEKLVSGTVTGSVYVVNKDSGVINRGEGNLILNEAETLELIATAQRIEKFFKYAVDIEFAFSKEKKLYILQARPISSYSVSVETAIENVKTDLDAIQERKRATFGMDTLFTNSNIVENFPNLTPMGFGIFSYIFTGDLEKPGAIQLGRKDLGYACGPETINDALFPVICRKPYTDLIIDALTFRLEGISVDDYLSGFVARYLHAIREDPSLGNYPEGGLYIQHPSEEELLDMFGDAKGKEYAQIYQQFHHRIAAFEKSFFKTFQEEKLPAVNRYYERELESNLDDLEVPDVIAKFQEYIELLRTEACVDFVKVARLAFFGYDRLRNDVEQIIIKYGEAFVADCISFYVDARSEDATRQDAIKKATLDVLLQAKPDTILNETKELGRALDLLAQGEMTPQEFRKKYGHVGQLEISLPRYAESLDTLIVHTKKGDRVGYEHSQDGLAVRFALVDALRSRGEREEFIDSFMHDAAMANIYLPLRETAKLSYFKVHYLAKRALVSIAKRCNIQNGDIYLLKPAEISLVIDTPQEALRIIRERDAFNDAYREVVIPNVFFDSSAIKRKEPVSYIEGSLLLSGDIVRPGIAEGVALVAYTNIELAQLYEQYVQAGIKDIVGVFPAMDPSYGTRNRFAGLVTQYGGPLAHAAIIARDQKIPYLTGVDIAAIPQGAPVCIDASQGKVYVRQQK